VPRWRAVVLDLDDTLYPEAAYVRSGFRAVAGRAEGTLGIPAPEGERELVSLFEAGVRGDTFDRWLAARGLGLLARPARRELLLDLAGRLGLAAAGVALGALVVLRPRPPLQALLLGLAEEGGQGPLAHARALTACHSRGPLLRVAGRHMPPSHLGRT